MRLVQQFELKCFQIVYGLPILNSSMPDLRTGVRQMSRHARTGKVEMMRLDSARNMSKTMGVTLH